MYKILKFFLLLVLSLSFTSCGEKKESQTLSVATNTWIGYESVYLAQENSFLAKEIKLFRMSTPTDVVEAFRMNLTDIAFVTLAEALYLINQVDEEIKIITIIDSSHGADVILGQNNIKKLSDLKGKAIGVEKEGIGMYLLLRAFDLDKSINICDVRVVNTLYSKHEKLFLDKKFSALVTFEPVKTQLLDKGANVLFDSSQIPNEIIDVMIVKSSTLKQKKTEIRAFLASWYQTQEYIRKHHKEAFAKMALYDGISAEAFKKATLGIKISSLEENRIMLSNKDTLVHKNMKQVIEYLQKNKILLKEVKINNIISDAYLP